jgi:hypothetical protein
MCALAHDPMKFAQIYSKRILLKWLKLTGGVSPLLSISTSSTTRFGVRSSCEGKRRKKKKLKLNKIEKCSQVTQVLTSHPVSNFMSAVMQ